MPSKSLSKLSQNIVRKKGKNAPLHENSRDSMRLRTATGREDKLAKLARNRKRQNKPMRQLQHQTMFERTAFFQTHASEQAEPYTADDLHTLINEYLARNEDTERRVKANRTSNRPTSTKEDLLLQFRATEEREYASGFWMPDLLNARNVGILRDWTGDWSALATMTFVRVSEDGTVRPSKFPPTSMS